MQRWNPIELNFEGLEMPENIPTDRPEIVDKKWGHLSSYRVYSRSCVVVNKCQRLFFVFSADGSKKFRQKSQFRQNI